ncbi:MAG: disulfide bond formation protein B [Gammaproteobacteria bacterium]
MAVTRRMANGIGALFCAGCMGYALFAQHVLGLEPCPLCILQRVAMIALGLAFFVAFLHDPGRLGARIYGVLIFLVAAIGGSVSARHFRLQNLPPDQVPDCGPGLDYMLSSFPLGETLKMVLSGSGECAKIVWSFLGFSMPAWVFACFVFLGVAGFLANQHLGKAKTAQPAGA